MKIKLLGAFALGFAAGMAVLAVLLLAGGRLSPPVSASARQTDTSAGRSVPKPAPVTTDPVPLPVPVPVPATGEAEKMPALAMPIAGIDPAKLTSNFSEMRDGKPHEALDIMAPRGTPVLAVDQGNVVKLFTSKPGGLTVYQFNDARELCYYYAHLDRYAKGLKEGTLLRRGDVLGYVGSTGNASPAAPHLHFSIFRLGPEREWWKGTAVDPLPFLQGH